MEMICDHLDDTVLSQRVADYWDESVGRRWNAFGYLLPASTILKIASVVVARGSTEEDQPFWKGSEVGLFSVRSAHVLASGWVSTQE